jgi:hypothetical protein
VALHRQPHGFTLLRRKVSRDDRTVEHANFQTGVAVGKRSGSSLFQRPIRTA